MLVTVLTPSFNRAHTLPRLMTSLEAQTFTDFEWLVVDDGSTDGTRELVESYAAQATFPVRYLRQANLGKHVALNQGVRGARGRYVAVRDSDDWYESTALERLVLHWRDLPASFAEVQALCADQEGSLIGTRFPEDVFDSNPIALTHTHGVVGDKVGMIRTDVMREFPFPEEFRVVVTEALVWNRIAHRYQTRYVNEVLGVTEYQADGITASTRAAPIECAGPRRLYFRELATTPVHLPVRARFKAHVNWVRSIAHLGRPIVSEGVRSGSAVRFFAAAPIGMMLALRDRRAPG